MRKIFYLLLLCLGLHAPAFAQFISAPSLYKGESTFANLPTSPPTGTTYTVINSNGSGCNGSGSTRVMCEFNGSAYQIVGNGTVTTTGGDVFGPAFAVDGRLTAFSGASGKALKEVTITGIPILTSGVPAAAVPGTDYLLPSALNTPTFRRFTAAPTSDTPSGTFKRFGPSQSSNLVEFQDENGNLIAAITKTGAFTGSVNVASAQGLAQDGTNCTNQFPLGIDNFGNAQGCTSVTESFLSFSDVTTGNASTSAHGLMKKLPNDATKFYDGTGNFSTPPGQGTVTAVIAGAGLQGGTITQTGTLSIASLGVTNAMLAGSISGDKLIQSDITQLGIIGTGTWQGTAVGYQYGGTGQSTAPDDNIMVGSGTGWSLKTLPSCSNATTDKLLYNSSTNTFSCGVDQAATGGGGGNIVSLNSQTGATQTFANDTNVTIVSSGNTHTLTWAGTLAKGRQNAATVYNDAANTWSTGLQSFSAATMLLPHAASGASGASSDVIYDTTGTQWHWYINGTDRIMVYRSTSAPTSGNCAQWGAAGIMTDSGAPCPGAGSIGGSGTANTLAKFTASATVGNSSLTDDGAGTIGVGTCSGPCSGRLEIGGFLAANRTAPSTPGTSGTTEVYVLTSSKRLNDKADDGTVGTTVVGIANPSDSQFVKYIGTDGIPVRGSPAGSGDASTNTSSSVDSEVALFSGTGGKTLKRASATGIAKLTSGVLSAASAGTDYEVPVTASQSITRTTNNFTLTNDSATPGANKCYGTDSLGVRGWQTGCGSGSGGGGGGRIIVRKSSTQSIASDSATAVAWDSTPENTGTFTHSDSVNNSRIVFSSDGTYSCKAGVQAQSLTVFTDFAVSIRTNGNDAQYYGRSRIYAPNGSVVPTLQATAELTATAGQYAEVMIYQFNANGASMSINTEGNPYTYFACVPASGGSSFNVSGAEGSIPFVHSSTVAYNSRFQWDDSAKNLMLGDPGGSGFLLNLVVPTLAATRTITFPAVTSTLATLAGTETFTNKTLTAPILGGLLKMPPATITMSGNRTLTSASSTYQNLNTNGSTRTVTMDATTEIDGASFVINNIGAQTITLQNSAAATVATITAGSLASVAYDATGATWRVLGGSGGITPGSDASLEDLTVTRALTLTPTATTMSGNATLTATSTYSQYFDPNGSDRSVTLPTPASGMSFLIKHTGSANVLTIKDSGASTLTTLAAGSALTAHYVGSSWQLFQQSAPSTLVSVTSSATPTFDASTNTAAVTFKMTLTANVTSSTLSGAAAGQRVTFILVQDGTGSRTMVWPSNVKLSGAAFTLTTTASKTDSLTCVYDGSNCYESSRSTNM